MWRIRLLFHSLSSHWASLQVCLNSKILNQEDQVNKETKPRVPKSLRGAKAQVYGHQS